MSSLRIITQRLNPFSQKVATAILRYIDEHYPEPAIWSRDPKVAAAQHQLMD